MAEEMKEKKPFKVITVMTVHAENFSEAAKKADDAVDWGPDIELDGQYNPYYFKVVVKADP